MPTRSQDRPALSALVAHYDLKPPIKPFALPESGMNNQISGLHTGGGDLIWKVYTAQHDIESLLYEQRLLGWLDRQTLPFAVPAPLQTRSGTMAVERPDGLHALFHRLPGAPPDRHNPRQAMAVGAALAQLHTALRHYSIQPRPGMWGYSELTRVHSCLPDPFTLDAAQLGLAPTAEHLALLQRWRTELEALRDFIEQHYASLPAQVIHADFAPANTLFEGEQLVAILDFEFATPDARALDLASGLMFTLRAWEGQPQWEVAQALLAGYSSVMPPGADEVAALPWLMRLRNAVGVIWWLGRDLASGVVPNLAARLHLWQATLRLLEHHAGRMDRLLHTANP